MKKKFFWNWNIAIYKKNQVSWYHEGQLIQDKTSHRINLDSDGTLQVAEARASDAGKYTCEVSSSGQDTYFYTLAILGIEQCFFLVSF